MKKQNPENKLANKLSAVQAQAAAAAEINAMQLLDMPVFSISEAESIGLVKNIIIDPAEKCLMALAVDKRGWYHDVRVIPAGKIRSIGEDVINIDEKQSAKRAVNLPRIVENMHKPCSLVGSRIITDDGQVLGRVEHFFLNREGGAISRLQVGAGGLFAGLLSGHVSIPATYVMTIGAEAIVVQRACLEHLQVSAGVLQVNFSAARERATSLWQQGVAGSRQLGSSVRRRVAANLQHSRQPQAEPELVAEQA